jgi:hypothetical protein
MKTEEVGLNKLLLVIFLNGIFYFDELLYSLSPAKAAHVFLKISISALFFPKSRAMIVCEYPWKNEILVQITVASSTQNI